MAANGVDLSEWNDFWGSKYWQRVIKIFPEAKRSALFEAGKAIMQEVDSQIVRRGVNDRYGRVRSWQSPEVGSHGGYVAIRPDSVTVSTEGGNNNARDITRWLDHGHGVREPTGRAKRYRYRSIYQSRMLSFGNLNVVRGYMFYPMARFAAERIGIQAAEKCLVKWENAIDSILGDDYMGF